MGIIDAMERLLFIKEDFCYLCRENRAKDYICSHCKGLIEFVHKRVEIKLPHIEGVYSSVLYNRFIREKLHSYKFQGKNYLYKPFGEMLLITLRENGLEDKIEGISYVPIHRRKEALRGYNQSKLLAEYVAKALNIPLLDKHLFKVRWTRDQSKLDRAGRMNNLASSFKAKNIKDFKGKEILLIDDIITTGATLMECSKTLMEAGAKGVYGLVLTSSMKL